MTMRFEEEYKAFNQYGLRMPYKIVKNGATYIVVDTGFAAGVPPVPGPFPDLATTQAAVIAHAQTYHSTKLNSKP
jgi:hypothetical protein